MEIIISVLGAISAVIVAVIGAILSNKNSNMLQLRKLKEEHYISYIESLHNLAANNSSRDAISKYTYHRDKLLIVGSEEVVKSILQYENEAVGKETDFHDEFLTNIVKAIRQDLKIKDKNFPQIYLKK
ncbi:MULTISPECIES: hypothetical protein [Intestinimonas]|uniref:hypothetical protein n=1 Tax=Intestinimonas TaxID=1392389 RepID=UPI00067F5F97|nr:MULTISPECIES: hypothetical protein [Intestinimonas]MBS6282347.1 hypothetical protein [Oscillospiraceae bacterium]